MKSLPTELLCHARKYLGSKELTFAKGIFLYEWFNSFKKFDRTELPTKHEFHSEMSDTSITDDEYSRTQNIWTAFKETFKDYDDLYLKTDALLLSNVFENFRDVSMVNYCLDPAHYLMTPSSMWNACLKFMKVKLEPITDPEIFLLLESKMRAAFRHRKIIVRELTILISNRRLTTALNRTPA